MSKKTLGNILLTCVALAASLGLGELAVRLFLKDQTVLFPRYHTDYQYGRYHLRGIRPSSEFSHTSVDGSWTFTTNNHGFRNTKDIPYSKPKGTLRVLSLGDSHTQGYEVSQEATFSATLEYFLNAHNVSAEVLNTGVSGFSTAEELAFLENEGYRYEPDVVVLGFYANDFMDTLRTGLYRLDGPDRLVATTFEYVPGVRIQNFIYAVPGIKWLSENSYFYSLFFNGVWEFFKAKSISNASQRAPSRASADTPQESSLESAVATKSGHTAYQTGLVVALIKRMQAFCASRGIRLIVADIPTPTALRQFDSSFPPEVLDALEAAHVETIRSHSLLEPFRGAVEFHVTHGHKHISPFTHALIGAELGRRILSPAVSSEPTRSELTNLSGSP